MKTFIEDFTKLVALKPISIFIKVPYFNGKEDAFGIRGKFRPEQMENPNYLGFTYTIAKGEVFNFDRSNDWDVTYYTLSNGVEFKFDTGNRSHLIDDGRAVIYNEK